jgi:hypothetical protein
MARNGTAWAGLPNARYIDWVIESMTQYPDLWLAPAGRSKDALTHTAYHAAWEAAWARAWAVASDDEVSTAKAAVWVLATGCSWCSARQAVMGGALDTLLALLAYDRCGYLIESDPGEVEFLAALGDPGALLLRVACTVYHQYQSRVSVAC